MKIVYIHIATGNDFYSAMIRLSIASVRVSNPKAIITLLIDSSSFSYLKNYNKSLFTEVDEIFVQDTPNGLNGFKSRYLKTSVGKFIDGPFLFLDSDTFVRKSLDSLFESNYDLAGCKNLNRRKVEDQINSQDQSILSKLNCSLTDKDYINSGVLFFGGTEKSKVLSELWHKEWLKSYSISNEIVDQPALYSALSNHEINFGLLPDSFNSQLKTRFWFETTDFNSSGYSELEWDSSIWHFFASIEEKHITTEFEIAVSKLMGSSAFEEVDIQPILNRKHPWRSSNFLDEIVVDKVLRSSKIDGVLKLWLSGNRVSALKQWITKKF